MTLSPCIVCGEPSARSRCPEHQPQASTKTSSTIRGYDEAWRRLSERARRIQPWCTDCHTTEDLTVDHSEEAWRRREAGKLIRLRDVTVVCRGCNARRGRARPVTPGDTPRPDRRPNPASKAETRLLANSSHVGVV